MRKLIRHTPGPATLLDFNPDKHTWDDVKPKHKKLIWVDLVLMQGRRCAYCERKINLLKEGDKHIEHFLRKSKHHHLTFQWENLFGSCSTSERCGVFKDKQRYIESDLLKADEVDCSRYYRFMYSGEILLKDNLSKEEIRIAKETLRIFNLNPRKGGVKLERSLEIGSTSKLMKEFVDLAKELIQDGGDVDEVRSLIRDAYYKGIKDRQFISALTDVFETMLP